MEDILAEEARINRKLDELKSRKEELLHKIGRTHESLRDIPKPPDARLEARARRDAAIARNSAFLHELDMNAGKLHTKRLCPLNSKLKELKNAFSRSQSRP